MSIEMDDVYKREALILAIRRGYEHSHKAHELIFKEDVETSVALAYLNSAISFMNSAMAIHTCIEDKLREFEDIYHKFNVFSNEFLDCCATKHRHQWTDIEFLRFKEAYEYSIIPDYPLIK